MFQKYVGKRGKCFHDRIRDGLRAMRGDGGYCRHMRECATAEQCKKNSVKLSLSARIFPASNMLPLHIFRMPQRIRIDLLYLPQVTPLQT